MRGRICLITGATSGIGKETARALARTGATLILVARDRGKGEALVRELQSAGGGSPIHLLVADLSSQAQVRRLAEEVRALTDRLHVLVNNAGLANMTRRLTVDGLEETFAVNHLAYFLLTRLLLDLLEKGAPSRVVNVASKVHKLARLDFDDLQGEREYKVIRAYALSKLANVMFTYELARRLDGKGVTVNCLHPGGVNTNIWNQGRGLLKFLIALMRPFLVTPEKGARPVVRLATAADVEGVTGRYFDRMKETLSSPASRDAASAGRLWEISETLTSARAASA